MRLLGDVAIYVAPGSVDHRAHPELFQDGVSPARRPTRSPRPGSCGATRCTTGRRCAGGGYRWWVERLRRTLELFDLARIDHFRGFVAYWAVPAGARTASPGAGSAGPGRARVRRRSGAALGPDCRWSPRTWA